GGGPGGGDRGGGPDRGRSRGDDQRRADHPGGEPRAGRERVRRPAAGPPVRRRGVREQRTPGPGVRPGREAARRPPGVRPGGGARAAVGDVNRDGVPDLVVAAGFGGGPRIAFYDGTTILGTPTKLANDIFVFEQTLRNGVFVGVGDVDGDGFADLIAGGGPGGGARVLTISGKVLTATGAGCGAEAAQAARLMNFFVAGSGSDRGRVRLAAKDADGD